MISKMPPYDVDQLAALGRKAGMPGTLLQIVTAMRAAQLRAWRELEMSKDKRQDHDGDGKGLGDNVGLGEAMAELHGRLDKIFERLEEIEVKIDDLHDDFDTLWEGEDGTGDDLDTARSAE